MKQLLSIITALFLMLAVIGCGSSAGTNADTDGTNRDARKERGKYPRCRRL